MSIVHAQKRACAPKVTVYVPLLRHIWGVCGSYLDPYNVCSDWISPSFPQYFQLNAKIITYIRPFPYRFKVTTRKPFYYWKLPTCRYSPECALVTFWEVRSKWNFAQVRIKCTYSQPYNYIHEVILSKSKLQHAVKLSAAASPLRLVCCRPAVIFPPLLSLRFHCRKEKFGSPFKTVIIWVPFTFFNPLKTNRRPLYLKTQYVPRSKHFSSRL